MEIIMYCSVDTSTHTNHISKERGNSQQICNEELLGKVGLILNHIAKQPSLFKFNCIWVYSKHNSSKLDSNFF
jgi:hypothetical protein